MIVLLAVFVLMVVIGALADRSRRKKETSARPDMPDPAPEPPREIEPGPVSAPEPETVTPQPMKVTVRRSVKKPAPPAVSPGRDPVPVTPVGPEDAQDVTARLRRAQRMYDDGVITKREYKRARRRILDSI